MTTTVLLRLTTTHAHSLMPKFGMTKELFQTIQHQLVIRVEVPLNLLCMFIILSLFKSSMSNTVN